MSKADEINKELEETIKVLKELKTDVELGFGGWVNRLSKKEQQAIETVLNYIENSISKETIKEKIEEIINNNEYLIIFEGDAELPDEASIINAKKYIKMNVLQEILEGK